tara:strand:+ start:352 stop:540 length:189 start_codon:yes stop_codon:yes gene_type:complete
MRIIIELLKILSVLTCRSGHFSINTIVFLALFKLLNARTVNKNIIIKETGFISLMIIISNYF